MGSDFFKSSAQLGYRRDVDDHQTTRLHRGCNCIDAFPRGEHVKDDPVGARGFAVLGEHFLQIANDDIPISGLRP